MKSDIIFLSHNRKEFTQISLPELFSNTNPDLVNQIHVIDDASSDGVRPWLKEICERERRHKVHLHYGTFGAVVPTMNLGIRQCTQPFIGKIDNDTVVPPEWLDICMSVMTRHPELALLGIDTKNPVGKLPHNQYTFTKARHIGGIGLFRKTFFADLPKQNQMPSKRKYHGFTEFQWAHPNSIKGWLNPAIPTILLDRVPLPRFQNLVKTYRTNGWQRGSGPYPANETHWKWKFPDEG